VRTAVLTISTTSAAAAGGHDVSGPRLAELAAGAGCEVEVQEAITDDRGAIGARLRELVAERYDLVFTTGGTGLTPDDHTPEATRDVVERDAPGIAEAMRAESIRRMPAGMLSRGVSGVAGRTLIVNFPGSPKAIDELFPVVAPVLRHAVGQLGREGGRHDGGH
jgi:molybdenum cofactor synthesis domain-containing protein